MNSPAAVGDEATANLVTAELDAPRSARQSPATEATPPASSSDVLLRGRYVLEEKIGEGGTSVVYRARDMRRDAAAPGGQRVALKLLRPGLRDHPRAVDRLKREFHHAQTLSHPAIARVYDVDCDGGAWFLTLELLEGETLAALIDRQDGPLPPRRILDVLRACGEALAFAHERGVVHGDFKPGNVFITSSGQVRVLDFGSASASWLAGEAQGTTATPAYASPEVLSAQRPERRDDVFSFACVAYEMFTARHPYERRSALEARNSQRMLERDWNLSARQWHALEAGLAWSREERPSSIRALLADITSTEIPAPLILPDALEPKAQFKPPRLAPFSAFAALAALAAVVFVANWQLDDVPGVSDLPGVVDRTEEIARNLANLPPLANPGESAPASISPLPGVEQASRNGARQRMANAAAGSSRLHASSSSPGSPIAPPADAGAGVAALGRAPTPATAFSASSGAEALDERFDEAASGSLVSFDVDAVNVSEGAISAVLRINRRNNLAVRAQVQWRTLAGLARPGQDFREVARGTAEFAVGQTTRAIYVPLLNDLTSESDESFIVELFGPGNNTRINPIPRVLVTLNDDDPEPNVAGTGSLAALSLDP